jgi:protocatechuate 3,4-dioxygenase beta subunit
MKRSDFLKKSLGIFGATTVFPAIAENGNKDGTSTSTGNCSVTPTETAGPFSTKKPKRVSYADIVLDRKGTPMTIKIVVQNVNNNCAVFENAVVDIWHCDAEGNYSEYRSQTTEHFLRGRQVTSADGVVTFKSIFPGWYPGRAPHIHLQVLNSKGTSLLISQIAFPEIISDSVYAQGIYTKKGINYTKNTKDLIFFDGFSEELATFAGNTEDGYILTHIVKVKG